MDDVTALVLSIGEAYTQRALASLQRQTLPVAATVVVRGLSPFHRAFNHGVAQVRTAFFIQVDADMILDSTCVADLRGCVADGVGMVMGHLRDALVGRVAGIKLFRTECVARLKFRDSISCDTDFVAGMERHGWMKISALKYRSGAPLELHTIGEHRPDYTPHYTFCKYVIEGARCRYRKAGGGIRGLFGLLDNSTHSAALYATIAAAHGIFLADERDLLRPYPRNEEFGFLQGFLEGATDPEDPTAGEVETDPVAGGVRTVFKRSYALGIRLRRQRAANAFVTQLRRLRQQGGVAPWAATVGLCHGLFVDEYREADAEQAFAALADLLPAAYVAPVDS